MNTRSTFVKILGLEAELYCFIGVPCEENIVYDNIMANSYNKKVFTPVNCYILVNLLFCPSISLKSDYYIKIILTSTSVPLAAK